MTREPTVFLGRKLTALQSHPTIPAPSQQRELFPIPAAVEFPNATGTADAWGKVTDANGRSYVVKGEKGGLFARASEMFSALLAGEIGLQCPPFEIIQMTSGDLLFGSEEIIGVADKSETARILTSTSDGTATRSVPGLSRYLSSVFAFDMLIHNVDRHDQNFLSAEFHGTRQFFLIDHARSMFSHWPIIDFPTATCGTRTTARRIRQRHGFHPDAACAIIDRINGLAPGAVIGLMRQIPSDWLPVGFRKGFETWWGSTEFEARLQTLRKGLRDGSLL